MAKISDYIDLYLKNPNGDLNIVGKLIKIILILFIIRIFLSFSIKLIDKAFKGKREANIFSSTKRANTLGEIFKKIIQYVLYFIGIIIILEMFNINTTSILATAGIGGLAIGFGAQSLVKDIITGFFILLEDQYSVGDFVKIGAYEGIVEDLGLRATKLRAFSGEVHIIPNGSIEIVTNANKGSMRALVKVLISYEEDFDRIMAILNQVIEEVKSSNKAIIDGPTIVGISELGESNITVNIVARTNPMDQWSVERAIRKALLERFKEEKVQVPYPRKIVYKGGSEDA